MLTRLDDALIDHTKVEAAADAIGKHGYERALGAVVWGIVYANRRLTDGFLPQRAIDKYGITKPTAEGLVAAGLWEAADGGYRIHDYLDWNASAADIKAKQSRDRERKRKAFGFHAESTRNPDGKTTEVEKESVGNPRGVVLQDWYRSTDSAVPAPVPAPDPEPSEPRSLLVARFERFWEAYPNHEKRKDALRAFTKLRPDHDLLATMLDAIARWKLTRRWREGFVPHPATWLNQERWTDEVPVETAVRGAFGQPDPPRPKIQKVADLVKQGLA